MPGLEEVRTYMRGLWMLVKSDPEGGRFLDLTARGSLRSFWAILWCLPPMILSWLWIRAGYVAAMPPGTEAGGLFMFRLALSEAVGWMVPVLFTGLVLVIAGRGECFNPLVSVLNWLSVPVSYANGFLLILAFLLPQAPGIIAFFWLLTLTSLVAALDRLFRMICGPSAALSVALILGQIVPVLFLTDWVDRYLGIAQP